MGTIATIVAALLLWIIGWAIGLKSIDVFLVALLIMLVAVTVRMLTPYLPGKRE